MAIDVDALRDTDWPAIPVPERPRALEDLETVMRTLRAVSHTTIAGHRAPVDRWTTVSSDHAQ